MARKSKPWAVICSTAGGPIRTEHTSEAKAFEQVRAEATAAKTDTSRVTRIRVYRFDDIDPKEW